MRTVPAAADDEACGPCCRHGRIGMNAVPATATERPLAVSAARIDEP